MYKSILNWKNKPELAHRIQKTGTSFLLTAILLTGLTACGGGSKTESNSDNGSANIGGPEYTGPVARDAQVLGYQINVWDRLRGEGTCGRCHRSDSGTSQPPYFVDWLNVNNAFDAMMDYDPALINLANPEESRLVTKVAGGHNCWLSSNAACATLITSYIENWAAGEGGSEGRLIDLDPPTERPPGTSKFFPTFADAGAAYIATSTVPPEIEPYSIHSLLTEHCSGCHVSTAATPQTPYFADPNPEVSYEAVQTKIDLMNPANSRLVLRLFPERHQCWSDCSANSATMRTLIEAFADPIAEVSVTNENGVSKASSLNEDDAVVASGGNRYEANEIARYEFRTGEGTTIVDTSPVPPTLNLELQGTAAPAGTRNGDYRWLSTYGVEFITATGRAQATVASSRKLNNLIKLSGEYSIEAWVIPENVTQMNSNIISYSAGEESTDRNFTLGQTMYSYDFLQQSTTTTDPFNTALTTDDDDERVQTTLQHVVVTFDPEQGRRIYVNGEYTGDADTAAPGTLTDWNEDFALVFGGESGGSRPWLGTLRMVSIHNRALTPAQVQQNFAADVGQKYYLLFGISHLIPVPQAFIMFEVSQFDEYGYLFTKPRFITLDASVDTASLDIPLSGMRIGINARLAGTGQAYATLGTLGGPLRLGGENYIAGEGQLLSPVGTIIELKRGQDEDDFYLAFETLGDTNRPFTDVASDPLPPLPPFNDATRISDIGVRTFEEINVTMALLTNQPRGVLLNRGRGETGSAIDELYTDYYQQLPAVESIDAFLSSHQMGISQLALNYCNALVTNTADATAYFPGFGFGLLPAAAFADRSLVLDPLLNEMMNTDLVTPLATQPAASLIEGEINALIDRLIACPTDPDRETPRLFCTDDAARTAQIVKSACAAVLGSAVMLIQ